MTKKPPRADEQAARAAVRAVENVQRDKFEPNGRDTAPDWRMWMTDGRVADVEVTRWTDGATTAFFDAVHGKDDSLREWSNEKLSHRWTVMVFDSDPGFNKKRRPLEKLVADLASALAVVEAAANTPEQMMHTAQAALDSALLVAQGLEDSVTLPDFAGLQIDDGERSQHLHVDRVPEPAGHGRGAVVLLPIGGVNSFSGYGEMVAAIRDRIDAKTKQRQLDGAPGLKWLAVMLEDIPDIQLMQHFGPNSRMQPPILDGISFDYFHEVWVVSERGDVVLRLSDGGRQVSAERRRGCPRSCR